MATRIYPDGSRLVPTDVGLVNHYLRNMVEHKDGKFITTLDVYKDEPWLHDHVENAKFKRNEWYYFVPRIKRGGKTPMRTVPGRGESEGGTWKSTGLKTAIINPKTKEVVGYKQSLVYNKKVNGVPKKTDWLMTEYSLHNDVHDDLVLCWIRDNTERKFEPGFSDQVDNKILSNHVQEEEEEDVTQQRQPTFPPLLQGHDSGFETMMMTTQSNDNNGVMMTMTQSNEAMMMTTTHSNDNNYAMMMTTTQSNDNNDAMMMTTTQSNDNNALMMTTTQSNDNNAVMMTTTQSNDNNDAMMMPYQEPYQWDDFDFDFSGSENLILNLDELMNFGDISLKEEAQ